MLAAKHPGHWAAEVPGRDIVGTTNGKAGGVNVRWGNPVTVEMFTVGFSCFGHLLNLQCNVDLEIEHLDISLLRI